LSAPHHRPRRQIRKKPLRRGKIGETLFGNAFSWRTIGQNVAVKEPYRHRREIVHPINRHITEPTVSTVISVVAGTLSTILEDWINVVQSGSVHNPSGSNFVSLVSAVPKRFGKYRTTAISSSGDHVEVRIANLHDPIHNDAVVIDKVL